MKKPIYTYFSIDFKNMPLDFNYTICETLDDVRDYLQMVEIYLDDPELKASVTIKGISMTRSEYDQWVKENVKP